jgi:hypothetical protein
LPATIGIAAKAAHKGTHYELQRFAELIVDMMAALEDADTRQPIEAVLLELERQGQAVQRFTAAIRPILARARDEDSLCEFLPPNAAMIALAILRSIADPSLLQTFMGEASSS